jgi:hypothetical protein
MDCKQLKLSVDDYLDGVLPDGERHMAEKHLASCQACAKYLSMSQEIRHALRTLPVPAPSADFTTRILSHVHQQRKKPGRLAARLITALAASFVIWIGVSIYKPDQRPAGIDTIVMGISETRNVRLVFNAPEGFQKVTLQLELIGNIELKGFVGKRDIEWQTSLKKGANTLVLPITATGYGQAEVLARMKHQGKTRTFRIPLKVYNAGAGLKPEQAQISV